MSTWTKFEPKIVTVSSLPRSGNDASVWWISGSRDFGESHRELASTPTVLWMSDSGRRTPQSTPNESWFRLSHANVGGTTRARATFGVRGLTPLVIPHDPVSRSLGHVLKHSVRPTPCNSELEESHYKTSDRLSLTHLEVPILYPTHFSRTGWGKRALEPEELRLAFELPDDVAWNPEFPHEILPLELFRSVVEVVLEVLIPPVSRTIKRAKFIPEESPAVCEDRTWLPTLGKWLPGSWADTAISDRAVKSDGARVDFHTWNQRILLVLPCTVADPLPAIQSIEQLAMRYWRRTLIRSFFAYLEHEYGTDWKSKVVSSRKRSGPGGRVDGVKKQKTSRSSHNKGGDPDPEYGMDTSELYKDLSKGLRVLGQVLQSRWWEWTKGSSLFFWRWNGREQIRAARDGMRIFVQGTLPQGRSNCPKFKEADIPLVATKIDGMLRKGYLSSGFVVNLLHYFAVPKGEADIRVVFNGTSCGLNDALWSPNFYLPTARTVGNLLTLSTWMADVDFGDMFHNFPMDERLLKYSGVDVAPLVSFLQEGNYSPSQTSAFWVRWNRLFMGMKPSPYNSVRYYYWGEEFVRGDPSAVDNPMRYDRVILNLPCTETYDPCLPKVMKWNDNAQAVAGDVGTFIDDGRLCGHSKENCHAVHRRFASRFQYLGTQDAPRKYRPPSQNSAGAWTGCIFKIESSTISKTVSQAKWDKGKEIVKSLLDKCLEVEGGRPSIDHKSLEKQTGFLNHLAMTFEDTTPFLKGFYLTLNSWRRCRDQEGWKIADNRWSAYLFGRWEKGSISQAELDNSLAANRDPDAPQNVTAAPRLIEDLKALMAMFKSDSPPMVRLRSRRIVTIIYGFGDASGTGLGATFTCGSGFTFRIGVWGSEEFDESSNWKEFTNIVESLEEEAATGNLDDSEVFMFTDNSTVEACAHKGSSSSPKLLSLIVRLRALGTKHGIKIHIFHVAGTRMIAQGTDGVSRGYLALGIMAGEAMCSFIPIHQTASERSPKLVEWIKDWSGSDSIVLDPMGWFEKGHDIVGWNKGIDGFERPTISSGNTYIWFPPPFAAEFALAEMRKARIKRQTATHIFVCPRLCTSLWMKQLYKAADIVFEVPVGTPEWPKEMHEPLLIGVLFPFIRAKPWQLRSTPKMFAMARKLRGVFRDSEMDGRDLLRKFRIQCQGLRTVPEDVVRQVLFFEKRA
jgi:hypothetical protein